MTGILRCDRIDLNERNTFSALVRVLTELARNESNQADLQVSGTYYFSTPNRSVSPDAGWYIICDQDHRPLYAGKAENLNSRLNSRDGSRVFETDLGLYEDSHAVQAPQHAPRQHEATTCQQLSLSFHPSTPSSG